METILFNITDGDLNVEVVVTENADGTLTFDLSVVEDTGVIGDLNGLFFDLANDSIADDLVVTGADLTGDRIDANSVTKVDGWNNVNGDVVKEDGKFDVGVQFGTSGMAKDDIQSTSFTMSTSSGAPLAMEDILNQDFAVRLTSVGEIDGSRNDSVKISGTSEPIITQEPDPEPEPCPNAAIANDDFIFASSLDGFSPFGNPVNGFEQSILSNDTNADGSAYAGDIFAMDGSALSGPLTGSNGGLLLINPDGSVDFSANGEFGLLAIGEQTQTTFEYAVACGDTATIHVTVSAIDPDAGGGFVF